ncbi:ATP-binding protein [Lactobacillus sp. ESL0791]|uniref:ATP-binding protein n=1 Tax=Lactobacillus sp. ESL0791 TaxID=2983234 RepID=UPI0023F66F33|nr:ATP-binding protein [Lactobacillus sp. ESL0791]MDF7638275.1 ATP-binding protein [Lactobacillus sp. ESL0791]
MKNPFNPTFGDVPQIFLDKGKQVADLVNLIKESQFSRSFFITGVRGSGKTAFLTQIANEFKQDENCYYVDLLNREGILTSLAHKLDQQLHSRVNRLFNNINTFSIGGLTVGRVVETPEVDEILEELMEEVKRRGKFVVVTIDEVTNSKAIQDFAQTYSSFKRAEYPLYVIMTGLPDLILDIQNEDKLTFLLRSEKIKMSSLNTADVITSYRSIFNCSLQIANKMAQMTKGYSYGFQLLGWLYFEKIKSDANPTLEKLTEVAVQYQLQLFENAYQKIFVGLSKNDQLYLLNVNERRKFQDVVAGMHKSKSYVSQYRRRALERYLIVPSGYGYVEYTLPYFSAYLKQTQDPDSAYYFGY